MFEDFQVCPYAGLRSFTEEESLYFKGREEHIDQATEQLQRNKFLMLTGASGDGKSSLVFAGIIPNARAGFLKSRYTQWCIADFRPERSPFHNLCQTVARQLDIASVSTVEAELQRGFSALVDLYKNSKRHVDTESQTWRNADEKTRQALKRDAANLVLLVDQFEEFFTNPENYHNGVPSTASALVLNLLLETARIALEEDLPIYIVFTMRSDFVGQCAAFRGLPEYIGFSQFFVPRLNRSQLQQVIEEPAHLSGNRITRRLTERLIHDITDGVDQLPILQHALNQIWHAANGGTEEMDLVHYAMVGGMPVGELEADSAKKFSAWFESLPSYTQQYYRDPNLQNVLDAHTNKLYDSAGEYYRSKTGKTISSGDAQAIVRCAFTCLTKIDQSRAVRNRMTLAEITHILGKPEFDAEAVGDILNIFREPGNTFIHPFISEGESGMGSDRRLKPDQVLDITHESLIRNWELLGHWATEEFESHSISLDFGRQLNRWVASGKSNSHLFSIGPLTYFETWYTKARPNAWWIARYLPDDIDSVKKLERANLLLSDSQELLHRSANKHAVTRAIMRYGAKRIGIAAGILVALSFTSFTVSNYLSEQNSAVLSEIKKQSLQLAVNKQVTLGDKVDLLCEQMRSGGLTATEIVKSIPDPIDQIDVMTGIGTSLTFWGQRNPPAEMSKIFAMSDSLLDNQKIPANAKRFTSVLDETNDLHSALTYAYSYQPDSVLRRLLNHSAQRSAQLVLHAVDQQYEGFNNASELGLALETAINQHAFSANELQHVTTALSPIEGKPSPWVNKLFAKDNFLSRGGLTYGFKFNGLYQFLAELYAAQGDVPKSLQCIDTLLLYNEVYYQNDYSNNLDNAGNIAAVFFLNGHTTNLDDFVRGYCAKKKVTKTFFYERLVSRCLRSSVGSGILDIYFWMDSKTNLNLVFTGHDQLAYFYDKLRNAIQEESKSNDERNFKLALAYKNEGVMTSVAFDTPGDAKATATKSYDLAVEYFKKVSSTYRNHSVGMSGVGTDEMLGSPDFLFSYPDLRTDFHPGEPRNYFFFYTSDSFLEYVLDHNLFDEFYPTEKEHAYLQSWLTNYHTVVWGHQAFYAFPVRPGILARVVDALDRQKTQKSGFNLLYLYAGRDAQTRGDDATALKFYRKVTPENILTNFRAKEFGQDANSHALRLVAYAVEAFAKNGNYDEAYRLVSQFKKTINRSSLYSFAAIDLIEKNEAGASVDILLDSARKEMDRATSAPFKPHRLLMAYLLTLKDPVNNVPEARALVKNTRGKLFAYAEISRAIAFDGKLYQAVDNLPTLIADTDRAFALQLILYGLTDHGGLVQKGWEDLTFCYDPFVLNWIAYIDEGA